MDGISIAKNFLFDSKYSSNSDNPIYDIEFDTECSKLIDNDNFYLRYIIRLILVKYFKLLTNNVNKSSNDQIDYNTLNSDLVFKKKIKNDKPDTVLGLFEITNKVTSIEDNYINLEKEYSEFSKILNLLNIFTTTRYLKYYLNLKSIKSKLVHVLNQPKSNEIDHNRSKSTALAAHLEF